MDILPKFNPTVVCDILTWDYTAYPPGHFDVMWCSPPCQEYSKAKTVGGRNLTQADACVRRCFEIIDYLQPRAWLLENPATGLLPRRMEALRPGLSCVIVDYCAYGANYRKRTAIWHSSGLALTLETCRGAGACPAMIENRHRGSCANTTPRYNTIGSMTAWEKCAIPEGLIDYLVAATSLPSTQQARLQAKPLQ